MEADLPGKMEVDDYEKSQAGLLGGTGAVASLLTPEGILELCKLVLCKFIINNNWGQTVIKRTSK